MVECCEHVFHFLFAANLTLINRFQFGFHLCMHWGNFLHFPLSKFQFCLQLLHIFDDTIQPLVCLLYKTCMKCLKFSCYWVSISFQNSLCCSNIWVRKGMVTKDSSSHPAGFLGGILPRCTYNRWWMNICKIWSLCWTVTFLKSRHARLCIHWNPFATVLVWQSWNKQEDQKLKLLKLRWADFQVVDEFSRGLVNLDSPLYLLRLN